MPPAPLTVRRAHRAFRSAVRTILLLTVVSLLACGGDPAEPEEARIGPYPASHFLIRHDLFLPAFDPQIRPASAARELKPNDEVFGVEVDGRTRAYPIPCSPTITW